MPYYTFSYIVFPYIKDVDKKIPLPLKTILSSNQSLSKNSSEVKQKFARKK